MTIALWILGYFVIATPLAIGTCRRIRLVNPHPTNSAPPPPC